MGQQQLLLVILGVIIVGIAVAVGITMFTDSAINLNRDAVTNDLVNLAARAQQYYRRPTAFGGGGNSFVGLTADAGGLRKLTNNATNANGSYSVQTAGTATGLVIRGVGKEYADNVLSSTFAWAVDGDVCTITYTGDEAFDVTFTVDEDNLTFSMEETETDGGTVYKYVMTFTGKRV